MAMVTVGITVGTAIIVTVVHRRLEFSCPVGHRESSPRHRSVSLAGATGDQFPPCNGHGRVCGKILAAIRSCSPVASSPLSRRPPPGLPASYRGATAVPPGRLSGVARCPHPGLPHALSERHRLAGHRFALPAEFAPPQKPATFSRFAHCPPAWIRTRIFRTKI